MLTKVVSASLVYNNKLTKGIVHLIAYDYSVITR